MFRRRLRSRHFARSSSLDRLSRLPIWWWVCSLALAFSISGAVGLMLQRAERNAERFGELIDVPVAAHSIAQGTLLAPDDVRFTQWPRALLPAAALAPAPVGERATVALSEGEPIVSTKLAPGGLSEVAALLQAGERAVDISRGNNPPNVTAGDIVEVLAATREGDVERLSGTARVIEQNETSITVAVPKDHVDEIVAATAKAEISLAVMAFDDALSQAEPSRTLR